MRVTENGRTANAILPPSLPPSLPPASVRRVRVCLRMNERMQTGIAHLDENANLNSQWVNVDSKYICWSSGPAH